MRSLLYPLSRSRLDWVRDGVGKTELPTVIDVPVSIAESVHASKA